MAVTLSHTEILSVANSTSSTPVHGSDINIDTEYANHMYQHGTKSAINAPQEGRPSEYLRSTICKIEGRIRNTQKASIASNHSCSSKSLLIAYVRHSINQ